MNSLPLTSDDVIDRLGTALTGAGFTGDGIGELLGERASTALAAGTWWPALRATRQAPADQQALAVLVRLFVLGGTETDHDVAAALPGITVDELVDQGVVTRTEDGVRALLDIRPHGADDHDYLVISDQDSLLHPGTVSHEHVLGVGAASLSLAHAVIRTPFRRALDIGTGCGIQSLHLSTHCDEVVATDTNPRALALASATARLNGLAWDLREGSLFAPVAGERFDLIVANPPFVVGSGAQDYIYRDSGIEGDGVSRQLIEQMADHLEPGGIAQLLANWIVRDPERWDERIRGWVEGTGLDAWVVQRELADPVSYVSLWTADAGENLRATADRATAWLDWFEREKIAGIGMGLVTLRKPETRSGEPDVVIEEILDAGQEVTGFEAQAYWARRDYLAAMSDEELLAARLTTAPVFLETQSLPGPDGWQQVAALVTRPGGPGAVLPVDEVMTALLAGSRGVLPLSVLVGLLADVHDVDPDALAEAALPVIREAVGRGILYEAE
ncbi:MAG: class I SAM-dependent methyltransferase [Gordonia sp. (in: high G+C Gram-positive bacteria)]